MELADTLGLEPSAARHGGSTPSLGTKFLKKILDSKLFLCFVILFFMFVTKRPARLFYKSVLCLEPCLDVPGMTEFQISAESKIGLMPERGIKRLLGNTIQDPEMTNGIARAEIYLTIVSPEEYIRRALAAKK